MVLCHVPVLHDAPRRLGHRRGGNKEGARETITPALDCLLERAAIAGRRRAAYAALFEQYVTELMGQRKRPGLVAMTTLERS